VSTAALVLGLHASTSGAATTAQGRLETTTGTSAAAGTQEDGITSYGRPVLARSVGGVQSVDMVTRATSTAETTQA